MTGSPRCLLAWLRARRVTVLAVIAVLLTMNLWSKILPSDLGPSRFHTPTLNRKQAVRSRIEPIFAAELLHTAAGDGLDDAPYASVREPDSVGAGGGLGGAPYASVRGPDSPSAGDALDGAPYASTRKPGSAGADAPNRPPPLSGQHKFKLNRTAPGSKIWYASHTDNSSFTEGELRTLREVFEWVQTPTARCHNLTRLGGRRFRDGLDGDKMACRDWPLTLGQPGCLVYSVGINGEWSFDRAAAALGCEVHSFDPSMLGAPEGEFEPGITFHRVGIGRNNHINEHGWSILVLDHLLAKLGHRQRTIQYLKADAEGGEMDMLIDQLIDRKSMYRIFTLDRVEQLGLEIHFRLLPELETTFYSEVHAVTRQLKKLGFDLVHSQPNGLVHERYAFPGVARPVSLMYEVLLVRRRRAAPDFDANVHYPCGSPMLCDLIDGRVRRSLRKPNRAGHQAAPP